MPWSRDEEDERIRPFARRQAKVCRRCRKVIMRKDDLVKGKGGAVLCGACASEEGDDAGAGES